MIFPQMSIVDKYQWIGDILPRLICVCYLVLLVMSFMSCLIMCHHVRCVHLSLASIIWSFIWHHILMHMLSATEAAYNYGRLEWHWRDSRNTMANFLLGAWRKCGTTHIHAMLKGIDKHAQLCILSRIILITGESQVTQWYFNKAALMNGDCTLQKMVNDVCALQVSTGRAKRGMIHWAPLLVS